MMRAVWLVPLAALAGCGGPDQATPTPAASIAALVQAEPVAEPDLAKCPKAETNPDLQRKQPLTVPAAFGKFAKSDLDHLAVVAADGSTICVDTSWIEQASNAKTSAGKRFLSFAWDGNEAYGHIVIDRSGHGQVIDTGAAPVFSPSGKRLAAVDVSESAFGALNAFAVWDAGAVGLKEIAHVDVDLPSGDWRIDGWRSDTCVNLSLLPSERFPEDYHNLAKAPRDPLYASENNQWRPLAGSCPTA